MVDGQQARLTQAALETLAVVAYRQPVSRARVSAIRGVNVDGVMRTLRVARAGRGGRRRRRDRRAPVPDHELLPRADGADEPRASCPRSRRSCRRWPRSRASWSSSPSSAEARRGRDAAAGVTRPAAAAAEGAGAAGVASRRKCETLMSEGRVEVDGEVVTQLGAKVDPETAVIRVDGKRIPVAAGARLPRREQAARRRQLDGRRGGAPRPALAARGTGPSGCSTSAGSTPTPTG